jgi:hypothetical protein
MLEYGIDGPSQFSRKFLATVHRDFLQHGAQVVEAVRQSNPVAYLRVCAGLIPKELLVEVTRPMSDLSDAELARLALEAAPKIINHMTDEVVEDGEDDGEDEKE